MAVPQLSPRAAERPSPLKAVNPLSARWGAAQPSARRAAAQPSARSAALRSARKDPERPSAPKVAARRLALRMEASPSANKALTFPGHQSLVSKRRFRPLQAESHPGRAKKNSSSAIVIDWAVSNDLPGVAPALKSQISDFKSHARSVDFPC